MSDQAGRRFLLGAGNAAIADWCLHYAQALGAKTPGSDGLPTKEVVADPSLRDGAAQLVELYRALARGLRAHLDPTSAARELRRAIGLVGYQTGFALTNPGEYNPAATGAKYLAADLVTRLGRQVEDATERVEPEFDDLMRNARSDIELGLAVALWHDDRVRAYLEEQQNVPAPPTASSEGAPIEPPLEGPGHILRVPDLHDPAYNAFQTWLFHGTPSNSNYNALGGALVQAMESTGLRQSFQDLAGVLLEKR